MSQQQRKDVLQTVDEHARRLAKTLIRSAQFGALGTLDPTDGAPSVSRVALATAMNGDPVFLISRLSGHFSNLEADKRCSLLAGEPGKGDPLAHPRITLIGSAHIVFDEAERAQLKRRYLARNPKAALYADFPDFAFWRFVPSRASFNGGFGKAYAMTAGDLQTSMTGVEDLAEIEESAVQHMNGDHKSAIDRYAARAGAKGDGWTLASLDPEGLDLLRGDETSRVWFDAPLASAADLRPTLVALAK